MGETLGRLLRTNKAAQFFEIVILFAIAFPIIWLAAPLAGDDPLKRQAVVWAANIVMLMTTWLGLRLRGQGWEHFGLTLRFQGWRVAALTILKSVAVFFIAMAGFVIGSIIMANVDGAPQSANLSGYDYLRGNVGLFALALVGVYIVSSFGEEAIYRAFLINRLAEIGGESKWAIRGAILVSAIIFGLAHFDWGLVGVVQTAFMGLGLGFSYLILKRKLWALVLAHTYLDTILLTQMFLSV